MGVELRKSFDTRSGLWLLASIGIAALLTTGAVVAWAPEDQLTYSQFTLAIGIPMSVILPIIAVLSVTAEWSQRSGLTTFTLVPHRSRILLAKGTAAVLVAATATVVAFGVGALGNMVGTAASDVPTVWDQNLADVGYFALGNTLLMLVGFTLGALIRNSPGRDRCLHGLRLRRSGTASRSWRSARPGSRDVRLPGSTRKFNQDALLQGGLSGEQWTQLGATTAAWLVLSAAASPSSTCSVQR